MATLLHTKGVLLLYASQQIVGATGQEKNSLFTMQNICSLSDTQRMSDAHSERSCDRCFRDSNLKNPGKMFKQ